MNVSVNECYYTERSWKHCGKWRNCLFWAISSFATMFQKLSAADASESVYKRERVELRIMAKNSWTSPSIICSVSSYFSLFYDVVVLINVILICLDFDVLEWGFFVAYFLEILLKWYTIGTKRYFGKIQHWYVFVLFHTLLSACTAVGF